ncbi:hypothetical protein [Halorubrum sp. N11]|uniref:hypothetical protein n=1 Tax=Halorubrum sp. N11 TaxID=3402276 RepID=UPI003EBBDA39
MKRPSLKDQFGEDDSSVDDQKTKAIVDALSANDKVIEIRPAKRSKGMGLKGLLLLGAGAIALVYWVQNSQKSNEVIEGAKEKAASRIHQTAEGIEEGSETASERIEEGSEQASEVVHETAEKASDKAEEAGEKASDTAEEAGEKVVAEMVKGDGQTSDGTDDASDSSET